MKYKNTRSSGRALGRVPVVWTWEYTRIAASTHLQLKAEDWNQHDVRCAIPNDVITEPEPNLKQFLQINTFSPAKAPNLAELCNPITCQAIELESYPNHPRIQQVL